MVFLCAQCLIKDLIDQGGLSASGDAGNTNKCAQWKFHIDVLKIVFLCANHTDYFSIAGSPLGRHRNIFSSGKILSCHTLLALADIIHCACSNNITTMDSCSRPNIHDIISFPHRFFIVFDHDQRITNIPKLF